jgi:transcription elongation factor Elf1
MGKRKSKAPPPKKVQPKLDTQFTCPFCNHARSVQAKLDFQQYKGLVECTVCGQKYACQIDDLSHAIDVYSDWIDACERLNAPGQADDDDDDAEEADDDDKEAMLKRKAKAVLMNENDNAKNGKKKRVSDGGDDLAVGEKYEKDFVEEESEDEDDFGGSSDSE